MRFLTTKPSAWLPIAMSIGALTLLIGNLVIFGIPGKSPADEGTAAHLFQLLMGGQIPIIIYFMFKWLPQNPKQTLLVLVLQFIAGLIAFIPIYILKM